LVDAGGGGGGRHPEPGFVSLLRSLGVDSQPGVIDLNIVRSNQMQSSVILC
jgi:hypothetical protein